MRGVLRGRGTRGVQIALRGPLRRRFRDEDAAAHRAELGGLQLGVRVECAQ